jgi:hypothetical protein
VLATGDDDGDELLRPPAGVDFDVDEDGRACELDGAGRLEDDRGCRAGAEECAEDEWALLCAPLLGAPLLGAPVFDGPPERATLSGAPPTGTAAGADPPCPRVPEPDCPPPPLPALAVGPVVWVAAGPAECDDGLNKSSAATATIARNASAATAISAPLRRERGGGSSGYGPEPPGGGGPTGLPIGTPTGIAAETGPVITVAAVGGAGPIGPLIGPAIAPRIGTGTKAGAADVRRLSATCAALGRWAGSEAVIAASNPGHGCGSPGGTSGPRTRRAATASCIGPSKLRRPVSVSSNTSPRA